MHPLSHERFLTRFHLLLVFLVYLVGGCPLPGGLAAPGCLPGGLSTSGSPTLPSYTSKHKTCIIKYECVMKHIFLWSRHGTTILPSAAKKDSLLMCHISMPFSCDLRERERVQRRRKRQTLTRVVLPPSLTQQGPANHTTWSFLQTSRRAWSRLFLPWGSPHPSAAFHFLHIPCPLTPGCRF